MTQNERLYEICCRPEVDDDVISGRNVKTIEGYIVVNFEVASFSSFRDFSKRFYCDGDSSGGVNAICSRPKVADDVISGEDAETFQEYVCVNLCVAGFNSLRENRNRPFCNA